MNIIERLRLTGLKRKLDSAFKNNSEQELLKVLKDNSFLFYELVERTAEETPIFHEIPFGNYRCDFMWYDRSSYGTHCVLVEVEKPNGKVFTKYKPRPSEYLTRGVAQIKDWKIYLDGISNEEKKAIFGNIFDFKYILVAGTTEEWEKEAAQRWRADYNKSGGPCLVRSTNVFYRALERRIKPEGASFYCFDNHPTTLSEKEWRTYVQNTEYLRYPH